ncbi:outer membrane protein transport protein [Colwellia sp. MB02u-18]|uniref:outer membrane protein transport protein n=1 Tax=unclassified Colwellia TaxID=196834 RepID=UPI0015F6F253|nr:MULTISPECIES: outer membrane protein transport protein [unclassified Colwellia]MBA6225017.1 outer membrane protein transport protein [Colwellia sp. MB3u-45]MBA6268695.1 outer membrane protein transport protein [Colwellia sp. MB3u-43]MBA6321126.1 outer membrane protein transport protein [Colwellia sp. MB02u-19]MBA6325679.1 outer membrane protein transport protein [Colwellia sp. MB02u-18]MBA6332154.1 outer membrane protein transport protein [Colwellia sp. MB02u-12]
MTLQKSILAAAITLATFNSYSASFQLNETSASGLGRAFAGDSVIADDAAVLARNPAAMALFDKSSFSLAATYIDPGVNIKGIDAPDMLGADYDVSQLDQDGVVPTAIIPAMYFINPVNDTFAYGIGINSNFGLKSEYDNDYAAGSIGGKTDLKTVNANISGSYRVNSQLSLGLGMNLVYGEAELIRHAGSVLKAGVTIPGVGTLVAPVPTSTEIVNMAGDDFGYGWNAGVVYEINEDHRFALSYRSKVELAFEGEFSGLAVPETAASLSVDMPAVSEFSGFHQVTPQWATHYSIMYTQWSSFEKLEAYAGNELAFEKQENFEDSYRFALGATYDVNPVLALRLGVAFDQSAAEDYRSISIPDSDRLWYSAGATYQLSSTESIDFGISYINGDNVVVTEEDALLGQLPESLSAFVGNKDWSFSSEGNALLLAVQYNKSF